MSIGRIRSIAVDWGTSNLRVWGLSGSGEIQGRAESDRGMAVIAAAGGDFEDALVELVRDWLREGEVLPVLACGMVGAREGWTEVPYDAVPCSPRTGRLRVETRDPRMAVSICAGVRQDSPVDVMRGEETQISGLLAGEPDFGGLVCLPGTHSKWAEVREGRIQRFRTYLTGECFDLLSRHSLLRHVVAAEGWDQEVFLEAVRAAMGSPEDFLAGCFRVRAEALLEGLDPVAARSRLSGLLIGQEIAGVVDAFPGGKRVAVIGVPAMNEIYRVALESCGFRVEVHHSELLTLLGLMP